jgi:chemotaxis protein methyltransferase CheR
MTSTSIKTMIKLTDQDFSRFKTYIYQHCGINLTEPKRSLLEGRLQKRLLSLRMESFSDYYKHVTGPLGKDELILMIDSVSTNKTDFFRESAHFSFLSDVVVPTYLSNRTGKPLRVWSSACSTGEEPYTTAIVLQEATERQSPFDYKILATDISCYQWCVFRRPHRRHQYAAAKKIPA